jgi:CrcB protein
MFWPPEYPLRDGDFVSFWPLQPSIIVFLGGGLGSVARLWVSGLLLRLYPNAHLPWGTLTVNLSGSLLIGFLAALWIALPVAHSWRLFLITGVLGGFTTFSAFSLEALNLWRSHGAIWAVGYGFCSVILGFLLAAVGFWLGKQFI